MIEYLIHNADGSVFQRGHCATAEDIPQLPGKSAEVIHKNDPRKPPGPPPPTYREFRQMDYPSIGDQLDALWKLVEAENMTKNPDVAAMLSKVKAVKTKYPKE